MEACGRRADFPLRSLLSGRALRPWHACIANKSLVSFRPLWPCRALLAPRASCSGWSRHALVAFPPLRPGRALLAFRALLLLPAGPQEYGRRYHKEYKLFPHGRLPQFWERLSPAPSVVNERPFDLTRTFATDSAVPRAFTGQRAPC